MTVTLHGRSGYSVTISEAEYQGMSRRLGDIQAVSVAEERVDAVARIRRALRAAREVGVSLALGALLALANVPMVLP